MNSIEPGPEFYKAFTPNVTGRLFAGVQRGYETALDSRMPEERGYTEQMFGFNLYGYCVHELTTEIENAGAPFVLLRQGNAFRFQVGGYEIGCYRAGKSERDSIWSSFPDNDTGIQSLSNDQMWLPTMEPKVLPKLVLAHLGNSEDGLCALYLCAPKRMENGSVVEWAFAHEVWSKPKEDTALAPPASPVPEAPAAEKVHQPLLRRKPRKEHDEGHV